MMMKPRPILLQLLAVVEYLHANHVIHRDLKLGNLFLKQGPMIKLGDFGLATLVYGENDRKRTICGTPNYIAPEILLAERKDTAMKWISGPSVSSCIL